MKLSLPTLVLILGTYPILLLLTFVSPLILYAAFAFFVVGTPLSIIALILNRKGGKGRQMALASVILYPFIAFVFYVFTYAFGYGLNIQILGLSIAIF